MKNLIILIAYRVIPVLLMPIIVAAETVYKTIDADGNIGFSDQSSSDATKIEIRPAPALTMPATRELPRDDEVEENVTGYAELAIRRPLDEETIRSNSGNLNVVLALTPVLEPNHNVVLQLDSKEIATAASLNFLLNNIDRGEHRLRAQVVDENKKVLIESEEVTFFLLRFSQLFNQNNRSQNTNAPISPINPLVDGLPPVAPATPVTP